MMRRVLRRACFACLVTVALFATLEAGLRLTGMPSEVWRPSPLPYQSHPLAAFRESPIEGAVFVGARGRLIRSRARGTRVLVFGSSAAYGLGSPEPVAFSGQLEHLLAAAMPLPVEVVNLGMPGFGSRQTAELIPQALEALHPDLIVVYSGNNEFHELRAWKVLGLPGYPEPRAWERTALFTAVAGFIRVRSPAPTVTNPTPVSQLAGDLDLADRAAVDRYYARQLDRMVESAQHAGVPILLVTVADNLLRSIPGAASPPERAQLDAFERDRGHLSPEALAARIAGLPDGVAYAALYYHFGVSLLDAGRPESAMFYLERAERLDPDPARSSYTLRAALKEIAERRGAAVCDLAAELPRYSARGVPGPDLFWDHCHFTAPGHRAVAHILAACIAKDQLLPQLDASALAAAVSESDDPWRVDSWEGNPPQPAAGDTAHQDALRETLDGHALLAGAHADRAFDRYSAALTAGGPAGAGHLDRALSRMYNNETDPPGSGSRTALAPLQADLELAAKGFPDDPWVQDLWALWR